MSKKSEKYLEEAQLAMGKRNYQKAIKYFQDYLELEPDDKKVLYTLADAYALDGNIKTAVELYLQVADHLRLKGFIMKAIAVCKRVLTIDTNNFQARDLIQRLYKDKSSEEETSKTIMTQVIQDASASQSAQAVAQSKTLEKSTSSIDTGITESGEVSVSGLQAVSSEPGAEKTTGSVAYKETVMMRKAASPSQGAEPVKEKIEMPDSITGGFVPITAEDIPVQSQKPSGIVEFSESDFNIISMDEEPLAFPESPHAFEPVQAPAKATSKPSIPVKPASQRTQTQELRILRAKDLLFDELTSEEYFKLIDLMEIRTFQPGEIVVKEGSPGDSMFIICSGDVSVVTKDRSGKDIELAELGEGDFFGEVSLLTGKPRTATIFAITYTELLELKRQSLPEIENHHPNMRKKLEDFYHRRTMNTIETLLSQSD